MAVPLLAKLNKDGPVPNFLRYVILIAGMDWLKVQKLAMTEMFNQTMDVHQHVILKEDLHVALNLQFVLLFVGMDKLKIQKSAMTTMYPQMTDAQLLVN